MFWRRDTDPHRFLSKSERQEVVAAIQEAERGTSGEVRIHVERRCKGDPLDRAGRLFQSLGMARTELRNGVLLYIALVDRRFAILGDEGVHREIGEAGWAEIRDRIAGRFASGEYVHGICEAVTRIGAVLKTKFPRQAGDVNELPDDLSLGE